MSGEHHTADVAALLALPAAAVALFCAEVSAARAPLRFASAAVTAERRSVAAVVLQNVTDGLLGHSNPMNESEGYVRGFPVHSGRDGAVGREDGRAAVGT